jgi:tetratricopeptide (TPR) repeat protein
MAEVALREQINNAIGEKDIQSLRAQLSDARTAAETKEVKSIVMPQFDLHSTRFWRNSVAMIIVLIGLAGALNMNTSSVDNTYNKFFDSPTWASERSATSSLDDIQTARLFYQEADYEKVIGVLNNASLPANEIFVAQFYKALSYQNMNQMDKAIEEYTKVIDDGDNMYIEEAEWYRSLCYLKQNKKEEAKQELLAVIDRKGHYENDAKAIIRKLRYNMK